MINIDRLWTERAKINPNRGLPLELFEWISSMVPIPNVDLMVLNEKNEILLSWRDDEYYGRGWHLPGGCIRFKETAIERVQKTAKVELGSEVIIENNQNPIAVKDMIMGKDSLEPYKRAHHIAILYKCKFPEGFVINNGVLKEEDAGFLKWFEKIPNDILKVHDIYFDIFREKGIKVGD